GDAFGGEPDGFEDAPAFRLQEQAAVYGGARPRTPVNTYGGSRGAAPRAAAAPVARPATPVMRPIAPPARPLAPMARPATAPARPPARPRLGGAMVIGEPPGAEHP